jgi:hypothetical protein
MITSTLTRSLADFELDPERLAAHEAAYRRGVHQALALASELVHQAGDVKEARRLLRRAEYQACRLRYKAKHQGKGCLLDTIRGKLNARKQEAEP